MKLFFCCVLLAALNFGGTVAPNPELAEIKYVYLLPMSYALDQFLAIRLTKGGSVRVVTDPKQADAILSDHIGTSIEEKLASLYGEQKHDETADKDKDKDKTSGFAGGPMAGGTRSKGAVFLLDRKTRGVVWSDFVRPKNASADELNRVADKIATRLERDKKGK